MSRLRLCYVGPAMSVNLRRWVGWFVERGHEATVITIEPADAAQLGKFQQVDLSGGRGSRKVSRLISAARMAGFLTRLRPDVIHLHYVRGLAWGTLLGRHHPCVATPWGSDILSEQGAFKEWYSERLTRAVLARADLVTVHSDYLNQRLQTLLRPDRPTARIGWGVDQRVFRPGLDVEGLRERWNISRHHRVVLSPRLAQPFYRIDQIVRAFPHLYQKIPEAILVIAGMYADQAYATQLRRLVSELGIADRVRFIGSVAYEEMPLWYNLAEAVVMVPISDGMPNSLLEAMACGTVPILSKLDQYREVVTHDVNGFLVQADGRGIADAVLTALSSSNQIEQMRDRNRAWVIEHADQEREMSRMENYYMCLASGSRAHVRA